MFIYLRLKSEVERLEVQYKESLAQQQARFSNELSALREQLQEAEATRDHLQREVLILSRYFLYLHEIIYNCEDLLFIPFRSKLPRKN